MFVKALRKYDQDHKGCFLFNTALQINTHDEEVNAIVTNGVREIERYR